MQFTTLILSAAAIVLIGGPLMLAAVGFIHARHRRARNSAEPTQRCDWKLMLTSALLYALAYNLIFFIQELFLVLPKAFTPGLRPTLFHNNHTWEGVNPLASLFQGTGALAILITAIGCGVVQRRAAQGFSVQLLLFWMTYHGLLQSLPQVIFGALSSRNDVGMAMDYLQISQPVKTGAALLALCAIVGSAWWVIRPLLRLAATPGQIDTPGARTRFVLCIASFPALLGTVLVIPFRVPREWIEVLVLPVIVAVTGVSWLQAGAWRISGVEPYGVARRVSPVPALSALLILLFVFQVVLRPGIAFY